MCKNLEVYKDDYMLEEMFIESKFDNIMSNFLDVLNNVMDRKEVSKEAEKYLSICDDMSKEELNLELQNLAGVFEEEIDYCNYVDKYKEFIKKIETYLEQQKI